VGVDDGGLQADSQPKSVSLVRGLVAACNLVYIHRNEPTELSQWPCLDDSTIDIAICISITVLLVLLVAWLSGNALVSINEVTMRRARLILGWVTVCEKVNHLVM